MNNVTRIAIRVNTTSEFHDYVATTELPKSLVNSPEANGEEVIRNEMERLTEEIVMWCKRQGVIK